jgi:small-conductance mechanosensitive channel
MPGNLLHNIAQYTPVLAVAAACVLVLTVTNRVLRKRAEKMDREMFFRQLVMFVLTGLALLAVIVALPVDEKTHTDLLGILGLVLTGIVGLSSTTFVTNAMAGLMLRAVHSFRPGEFIRTGEQFGRVTERGLFHTEIQTADSDLTTIPNLYLVTHPVTVIHSTGTIVSCNVSFGYDISHSRLEPLFLQAAEDAGLANSFVQILELGDYTVVYRIAGELREVKHLLTARSRLRKHILDTLHGDRIEIMSPAFTVQRPQPDAPPAIPPAPVKPSPPEKEKTEEAEEASDDRVFEKAEEAATLEDLKTERAQLLTEIDDLKKTLAADDGEHKQGLQTSIERKESRIEEIRTTLSNEAPGAKEMKA